MKFKLFKKHHDLSDNILTVLTYVTAFLLVPIMLYPFWEVLIKSFLNPTASMDFRIIVFPKLSEMTLEGYKFVLSSNKLIRSFFNSIGITVIGTFYQLFITSMCSFVLLNKNLIGRKLFLSIIIFTMFFGGGIVPYYMLIRNLGLVDNMLVYIIPSFFSVFNMIVIKTFMQSIPAELLEAAEIDGATVFAKYFSIMLPLSKAVLVTIGLFIAVGKWNNWFTGLLYIRTQSKLPMANILQQIVINSDSLQIAGSSYVPSEMLLPEGVKMAVVIVSVLPIVMIYPFIQKHFIKGVMLGAIKS